MKKITKETTLAEILKNSELAEILRDYNLPCLYCPMARFEMENLTLKEVCQKYNIDLKTLLKALNQVLKTKS